MKYWENKIIEWCRFFNIAPDAVKSSSRKQEIKNARFCIMRYLYDNCGLSLSSIGCLFGDRDHSTVINAKNSHRDLCLSDKNKDIEWNKFKLYATNYNDKKVFVLNDSHKKGLKDQEKNLKYKFEELLRSNKGKIINESLIEKFKINEL
ncbi:MAG: hypothetical protein HOB05_02670 [Bacteroidetes bacterium]|jgi:hypothetical protein|nr:hypothetical protein [Bacteroidota bacterium]